MSIKVRLILSAIVLLVLALGFNVLLSLNSLEKLYLESIASQYSAIGKDLQRNVEKALKFGKRIDKFIGMDKILEETKQNIAREITEEAASDLFFTSISSDVSVSITLPDGLILYSTNDELIDTTLPEKARRNYDSADQDLDHSSDYLKHQNTYIISLPLRDMRKKWVGSAITTFDEKQVKALLTTIRNRSIKLISLILVCSILLLILLLRLAIPHTRFIEIDPKQFPKLKIYLIMLLMIGLAQIVFSVLNTNDFKNYYLQINKEKTKTLTSLLKEDIEFFFSKGIRIDKLVKMDVMLGEIMSTSPELRDIAIFDQHDKVLYAATQQEIMNFQKVSPEQSTLAENIVKNIEPDYNVRLELIQGNYDNSKIKGRLSITGYISTNISRESIVKKLWQIGLDSATVLIISFLFFVEMLILIFQFLEQSITHEARTTVHYKAIRPVAFLFLFGIDISISFLPLHMATLYEPIFGLSKDIVMGLPISVQMFFAGISILIAGFWLDHRGWHEPFLIGLLLSGTGFLYSWLAPNALHFIVALGVVGMGFGLSLISAQGFVLSYTTQDNKAQGIAQLIAGFYAGSICGGAIGAMLAERMGYRPVFLVGGVVLLSIIPYSLFFMRNSMKKPESRVVDKPKSPSSTGQLFPFLFNRNVFSLTLFCGFPAAIAMIGILNYFSPIYLKQIGTSQSDIGRVLMIYGLCLIYLSPIITKHISGSKRKKKYIVISGIFGSLAFLSFYALRDISGIVAVSASVLLLGISGCFVASQNAYLLSFRVSQDLGEGKAIGVFKSMTRVGQVVGPLLFAWLFITIGFKHSIIILGAVYLILTFIFIIFGGNEKRLAIEKKQTT